MTTRTATRRKQARHTLAPGKGSLSYDCPRGGRSEASLVDLSGAGLSFHLESEELGGLEAGASVSGALIRIGSVEVRGEMLVMHVTPRGMGFYCGALFYPADDADLVRLKTLIAGIEAVRI